jgi:hypothetical protein
MRRTVPTTRPHLRRNKSLKTERPPKRAQGLEITFRQIPLPKTHLQCTRKESLAPTGTRRLLNSRSGRTVGGDQAVPLQPSTDHFMKLKKREFQVAAFG